MIVRQMAAEEVKRLLDVRVLESSASGLEYVVFRIAGQPFGSPMWCKEADQDRMRAAFADALADFAARVIMRHMETLTDGVN